MSRAIFRAFVRTIPSRRWASASTWSPHLSTTIAENPSTARSGARRSCDTEYENASSSLFDASSWAVRSCTRRSSSALS
jgi:hypothetical protein